MKLKNAIKTVRLFHKKEPLIPLMTRWGKAFDDKHVLEEYPRPQMKRDHYINLNGYWDYAITKEDKRPQQFDGKILVPFSPEAPLSTVHRQLQPDEYLWYERVLPLYRNVRKRCLLHFGAIDQVADVYINHQHVNFHSNGYLPFEIDISEYLIFGDNILTVRVHDASDTSYYSRGKQKLKRGGMYYTAQSGIWQTVWAEWVSDTYIRDVKITPDYDHQRIHVHITFSCLMFDKINIQIENQPVLSLKTDTQDIDQYIHIENLRPWTPDDPYLYHMYISTPDDQVECYFAMRIFSIENDEHNIPRVCLNHQLIFMNGVLDQGYWPEGLYTACHDEAMIYDIETMKSLGFNMIRKHVKIEPARWYYHCDRLGMIVWQDMVNGGFPYHTWFVTWLPSLISWFKKNVPDTMSYLLSREYESDCRMWTADCKETVTYLSHFPCISTWVLFNEGWGQFNTEQLTNAIHELDPTRLIDSASGWFDQKCGDFRSEHHYFDQPKIIPEDKRAFVISEYGGYACPIEGHKSVKDVYGYQNYQNTQELSIAYEKLFNEMIQPLIKDGLCGAVYTQLSDIEEEVNGILTYDRDICKIKPKQ